MMRRGSSSFSSTKGPTMESVIRQTKIFFTEATDGRNDVAMEFEEFEAVMPEAVRAEHGAAEIRSWFELLDADASGSTVQYHR